METHPPKEEEGDSWRRRLGVHRVSFPGWPWHRAEPSRRRHPFMVAKADQQVWGLHSSSLVAYIRWRLRSVAQVLSLRLKLRRGTGCCLWMSGRRRVKVMAHFVEHARELNEVGVPVKS